MFYVLLYRALILFATRFETVFGFRCKFFQFHIYAVRPSLEVLLGGIYLVRYGNLKSSRSMTPYPLLFPCHQKWLLCVTSRHFGENNTLYLLYSGLIKVLFHFNHWYIYMCIKMNNLTMLIKCYNKAFLSWWSSLVGCFIF